MKKYNTLIIGCGSIGALKPDKLDSPITQNILTHAHACYKDQEIIPYLYDNDYSKLKLAHEKWNSGSIDNKFLFIENFKYLSSEFVEKSPIDIIIIAAPTKTHLEIIKNICDKKNKPKVIILEKPAGLNSNQAYEIKQLCYDNNIKIIVNFTRRYLIEYHKLKTKLQNEIIYNCRCIYTRGLQREACHAIDLMHFFFGKFINGHAEYGNNFDDFNNTDLTIPAWLSFEKCKEIIFQTVNGNDYCVFEIDIVTNKGRYIIIENGMIIEEYNLKNSIYGNYKNLEYQKHKATKTLLETKALPNVLHHAKEIIASDKDPICDINNAIEVHKVIEKLKEK